MPTSCTPGARVLELLGKRKSKAYEKVFKYLAAIGDIESDRFNSVSKKS